MNAELLSIGELADAAGLTRRAVRFYVQCGLLPPPLARGRGAHYDRTHLARLLEIDRLQTAGHSLEAIRRILAEPAAAGSVPVGPDVPSCEVRTAPAAYGATPPVAPGPEAVLPRATRLQTQLLVRLRFAEGVELHLDATRFNPDAAVLLALRESVMGILNRGRNAQC